MKKSTIRRLLVLCLCLTLVSVSLIGGTLAKYTTTISANSVSGTVATWSFKIGKDTTTTQSTALSYTLSGSGAAVNEDSDVKKIAPGDTGTFDIVIDAAGSDVAVEYVITFTNIDSNVTLKYGDSTLSANSTITGYIAQTDVGSKQTVTINWSISDADVSSTLSIGDIKFNVVGSQAASNTTTTSSGSCTVGTATTGDATE